MTGRKLVRAVAIWLLVGVLLILVASWSYQGITHHDGVVVGRIVGAAYAVLTLLFWLASIVGRRLAWNREHQRS